MQFKRYEWTILIRVLLLFVTLAATSYCVVRGNVKGENTTIFVVFLVPIIIFQLIDFYRFNKKAQDEVGQFVESVHYRDFSRYFDVRQAPLELQPLRKGFNDINTTFKTMSREKETQYQYLQKILELVDTGIISYDTDSGEVVWLNESFKKMLGIPFLKTIESMQRRDEYLYEEVKQLKNGESKIVSLIKDKNTFKALMTATAFQTQGHMYRLIAFQNVNEALDETESKAWQRLLSVMTHEIMNSVAPISSLADTLKNLLTNSKPNVNKENQSNFEDIELGIDTIKRRSEGLLKFAETYRNLNKIVKLNLSKVYVSELFENLHQLMEPTLQQKNIELEIILKDPMLTVEADVNLVEQVLINLVVNAAEAVKEKPEPKIILSANIGNNNKVALKVTDNGTGIADEVLDKIFIPFFSTKKTGSGIGLSLCKQIMMLHKGNMQVQTVLGEGTAFILQF